MRDSHGEWRSLVAHPAGGRAVAGSNPVSPIKRKSRYQVGSALGLAAMTALASAQGADQLGNAGELTDGYSAAFLGAAGIAVAGALLAAALLRTPKAEASPAVEALEQAPIAA